MSGYVSTELRQLVVARANGRCEYCLLHQRDAALFDHEIDHIIAEKHRGQTTSDNLALACFECNRYKGSDISSIDPQTSEVVPLFNPRRDTWADHFTFEGPSIIPLTVIGRVTVLLLRLNVEPRVRRREGLIALGRYPG